MCYATDEKMKRTHGNLNILKQIVHNAVKYGDVERFVLVGGDPCEHPNLVELLEYIIEVGKENNKETKSTVISNTHDYRKNGEIVPIESVAPLLYGMCATIHSDDANEHDSFNKSKGSYEHMLSNLKKFATIKTPEQQICIILNLIPEVVSKLKNIMLDINDKLDGKVGGFAIQRIASIGRACNTDRFFIKKQDLNNVLQVCSQMKESGFFIEMVDAFPLCTISNKYWHLLPKGGCEWGKWCCAVNGDGTFSRCAMSFNRLSKNILELNSKEKFQKFWDEDTDLINFRKHKHLDDKCLSCSLLEQCGGGCVLGRITGDPYKNNQITKGHDYLRTKD